MPEQRADQRLFFTELLGLKVFDLKGRTLGVVKDAAIVPLLDPVRVDRFLIGSGAAWLTVRHDQVRSISLDGIHLRDEILTPYHSDEYMLRVVRDLLDQQIIDAQGRKVVRVTDVTFEVHQEDGGEVLWVLDVDIGLRAIFRRLVQGLLPPSWIRRLQGGIPPHSIRWEFCNILEPDPQRRLRLNISNRLLEDMHPADLADIVEDLTPEHREAIFENIDSEVAADALSEVDPDIQASILESLETEKAAEIVEEMAPDEAADVLAELEQETSDEILEEMEHEPKQEVRELLEFEEDSAGGMMNTEYVALPGNRYGGGRHSGAQEQRRIDGNAEHSVPGGFRRPSDRRGSPGAAVPARRRDAVARPGHGHADRRAGYGAPGPHHRAIRQVQPAGAPGGG